MKRLWRPTRTRARWQWVAFCALVALMWPSLGPLPWAVAHGHSHAHAAGDAHDHHDHASDIPGSPTHPADHDCAQCQVLKHLSRCAPPALDLPAIASQAACPVLPGVVEQTERASEIASLPPVRGPPSRIG